MNTFKTGDRVRVPVRAAWTGTEYATGTVVATTGEASTTVRLDDGQTGHWFTGQCHHTTEMQERIIERAKQL